MRQSSNSGADFSTKRLDSFINFRKAIQRSTVTPMLSTAMMRRTTKIPLLRGDIVPKMWARLKDMRLGSPVSDRANLANVEREAGDADARGCGAVDDDGLEAPFLDGLETHCLELGRALEHFGLAHRAV